MTQSVILNPSFVILRRSRRISLKGRLREESQEVRDCHVTALLAMTAVVKCT